MVALVTSLEDPALVDALEGNLWSAWSTLGLGVGCAFHRRSGALMVETPVTAHPYNMVQHFADEGDRPAQVAAVFAHFERRGVPFLWLLTPTTEDSDGLARLLEAHGFGLIEPLTGMAATLAPSDDPLSDSRPECGAQVSEVTTQDVDELYHFISSRWGIPDADRDAAFALYRLFRFGHADARGRFWTARLNGKVVAKALLHCGAGVAGIHGVATRPEARGRGLATALTQAALGAAYGDGYRVAVLHSTPMAAPVYESLGFRPIADFQLYGPRGDFHP